MKKIILLALLVVSNLIALGQQIIKAEYFFDSDPGIGQATSFVINTPADSVDFSLTIPVSSLSNGLHNLYVRTLNDSGVWSLAENRLFFVKKTIVSANIIAAEYFFDSDPGVGQGTQISVGTSADSIDFNSTISASGLSIGLHNLYIRTKNSDEIWSLAESRLVNVFYNSTNNQIVWSEYFFNNDPGVGNGVGSAVPVPGDSVEFITTASVLSLLSGSNIIYERTKNADGIWSLSEGRAFNICTVLPDASFSVVNSCQDSITQFINTTTGYDGSTVFSWDFGDGSPISNSFNVTHQYTVYGPHTVTFIASNGPLCADTVITTINIDSPAAGSAVLVGPSSFCINTPSKLQGTIINATSWKWLDSDFELVGTDSSFYPQRTDSYWLRIFTGCDTVVQGPFFITVFQLPDTAGIISGLTNPAACVNQNNFNYSIAPLNNATGYVWNLPALATIVGNSDTTSIVVDYSAYSVSGNVSVSGVNSCGTGVAANLPIIFKPIPVVQICSATVDSATQKVLIEWQKPSETYINGYVIYRETPPLSGNYMNVDTVDNTQFSSYLDLNSNPTIDKVAYKIGCLDSCGNIASISGAFYHQTIYLYGERQWDGIAKLYWNDYVGVTDPSRYYLILKDSLGNGPFDDTLAVRYPGNLNYTDISAPSDSACRYLIELVADVNCTPSLRMLLSKNTSHSNIKNKTAFPLSAITETTMHKEVELFPNPAKDVVYVTIYNTKKSTMIKVNDVLGQQLYRLEVSANASNQNTTVIPIENFSPGIYFVTVENEIYSKVFKLKVQ
ncbi:MAG: T9SS type A sorting domain-containing protein [Bacteroidia bacterium]|nr:T9SS type A sorting domain-containing protein [Bacteroidota bacterium]MBP6411809.1 T9SS type A sorting domain-containing protein [Bacteroidia bacterium]